MSLPKDWNGDLSLATLNPSYWAPELYYPLWLYSGSYSNTTQTSNGNAMLNKGTISTSGTSSDILFTLSANWNPLIKYALEISLEAFSDTVYAALVDLTSHSLVSSSQVSSSTSTFTVVRSVQFTLTPGHQYGVTIWSSTNSGINATDVSLIIFPNASPTSPSVSNISLKNPSGNTLKEAYIPLWMMSSGTVSTPAYVSGTNFISKGSISTVSSPLFLVTLSNSWNPNQLFALEASLYASTSSQPAYVQLWDVTASTWINNAQISTSSTAGTLIRSSNFTLSKGHSYALGLWRNGSSSTTQYAYLSKAHLVALGP